MSESTENTSTHTAGRHGPPPEDYRSLVSRADLTYDAPVARSEEGMPVGNGRMGSLVWTTPSALRFQINRVDVFASNCATNSFPLANTDYASGCGYVDIHFADFGEDVFAGGGFRQHLSVYDGLMTLQGAAVTARVLAWHDRDVMAVEIEDRRETPSPVTIDLRMLRYAMQYVRGENHELASRHAVTVQTGGHTATSRLDTRDGRILLMQAFREDDYYNASAVAIDIAGRAAKARMLNESTVRLSAAPGAGRFTVLIASASSFDPDEDVACKALDELDAGGVKGFDGLLASNQTWWHDFWSRAFVRLHSEDGVADFVEQNYTYFLYVMASSSRGAYPPRFGGMLWYTNGDMRQWGTQYWWANMSCYYNGLLPANRPELMGPMFSMYTGMAQSCALAARQQWGSRGIWIPETAWFNGLEELPEDIAEEMRDLYLLRKPWAQRSERFCRFAETRSSFSSRWNWMNQRRRWDRGHWVVEDKGGGPFGHVTHIFGTTAKIAYLYWQRYEYTQDEAWLREQAYPMLRGAVEFYRNFSNVKKGVDGKYHIHNVNSNEPAWGARDTDEDLSAMRGVLGALIRASEILSEDPDMRPAWQTFLDDLAPLPTTDHPDALKPENYDGPRTWVKGLRPAVKASNRPLPDSNTLPMWCFDLCTLEAEDADTMQIANTTFDAYFREGIGPDTPVSVLSRLPAAASALGRSEAVRFLIPNQLRCLAAERDFCDPAGIGRSGVRVLPNRLTLREGPGAIGCQRLGRTAEALHGALLQSIPPAPGRDAVIHVFPAWPRTWDAAYTLLARGAFLVSASMQKGQITFVEIRSQAGGLCRLRNPWPDEGLTLYRNEEKAENLSGMLLTFPTAPGERIALAPQGATIQGPEK